MTGMKFKTPLILLLASVILAVLLLGFRSNTSETDGLIVLTRDLSVLIKDSPVYDSLTTGQKRQMDKIQSELDRMYRKVADHSY